MSNVDRFGHFNRAIADMGMWVARFAGKNVRDKVAADSLTKICMAAATTIRDGGRFYLPTARHVLEDRILDDEAKALIRLPYDCTVVLSETFFRAEPSVGIPEATTSWKITVAIQCNGEMYRAMNMPKDAIDAYGFVLLGLVLDPDHHYWYPCPGVVRCSFPIGKDGYQVVPYQIGNMLPDEGVKIMMQDFLDDANSVMNLCTLLNLHNVTSERRDPPEKLNKARARRATSLLMPYHILRVDGEAWDRPVMHTEGTGSAKRSHMRRGHIRRLDEERHIWVRATYVKGTAEGFVGKAYDAS